MKRSKKITSPLTLTDLKKYDTIMIDQLVDMDNPHNKYQLDYIYLTTYKIGVPNSEKAVETLEIFDDNNKFIEENTTVSSINKVLEKINDNINNPRYIIAGIEKESQKLKARRTTIPKLNIRKMF